MEALYHKPMEIESRSMAIIEENLTGVEIPEPERSILKRVIHTTADLTMWRTCAFPGMRYLRRKRHCKTGRIL